MKGIFIFISSEIYMAVAVHIVVIWVMTLSGRLVLTHLKKLLPPSLGQCVGTLHCCRWRQYVHPKGWYPPARLHCTTVQKTTTV